MPLVDNPPPNGENGPRESDESQLQPPADPASLARACEGDGRSVQDDWSHLRAGVATDAQFAENPPSIKIPSLAGALQSAILHLRRGLRPDGTYAGIDEWECAEHQWRLLYEWAHARGLILPVDVVPARAGGYEHDVRHMPLAGRWLKFTKASMAGCAIEMLDGIPRMFPATPLQYLRRWRLANRVFADDVELVGLTKEGRCLRIVISQRHLRGEAPSWAELHFAMTELHGLFRLKTDATLGGYEARAYAGNRFVIFDVRPANFVRTVAGDVVPFDVIPQVLRRADAATLHRLRLK